MSGIPSTVATPEGRMKGSFFDPKKIEETLKQDRAKNASTSSLAENNDPKLDKDKAEKPGAEKEEFLVLPEMVISGVHGRLTYEHFKEKYEKIFTAVKDKLHLAHGFAELATTTTGRTHLVLRSLTKGQLRFVNLMSKDASYIGSQQRLDEEEFLRWALVFSLSQYGQLDVSVPKPPTLYTQGAAGEKMEAIVADFVAQEKVKGKLALLDDMPIPVYSVLVNLYVDLSTALSLAIQEDIKNP